MWGRDGWRDDRRDDRRSFGGFIGRGRERCMGLGVKGMVLFLRCILARLGSYCRFCMERIRISFFGS